MAPAGRLGAVADWQLDWRQPLLRRPPEKASQRFHAVRC
jgi:hypothetical protein